MRFMILLYIHSYNSLLFSNWELFWVFFWGGGNENTLSAVLISIQSLGLLPVFWGKGEGQSYLCIKFTLQIFFFIKVHPNDKGMAICLEQQDFNRERERVGKCLELCNRIICKYFEYTFVLTISWQYPLLSWCRILFSFSIFAVTSGTLNFFFNFIKFILK